MAAQTAPNYGNVTSQSSPLILNPLVNKYRAPNVVWPIVIIENDMLSFYLYEVNEKSNINELNDNRPKSAQNLSSYFIDYTANPRKIEPENEDIVELIDKKFNCSYNCVVQSDNFSSVDLDYVWRRNENWRALELTTVWMPLTNKKEATRLTSMFNRRPSWKGPNGPHGIRKQIEAAADLNLDYYMVVVNSVARVSNDFKTDGNAFWFPLNNENVDHILKSEETTNSQFGTFNEFLSWL